MGAWSPQKEISPNDVNQIFLIGVDRVGEEGTGPVAHGTSGYAYVSLTWKCVSECSVWDQD